jgi:hypothetical protein
MRLITLLVTVAALAVAAPAIADKGGNPHGGNGGGGGSDATATPTPTPSSTTVSSTTVNSNNGHGSVGGSQKSGDPSISIATVDGVAMAATTRPEPPHGSFLTFNTAAGSLAGWEYPMVEVSCYQDVDGNGTVDTNLFGPDLVFDSLNTPSSTFELAGGHWTGGAAVCHGTLYAYGWKGGVESIRSLASTYDWTATWQ